MYVARFALACLSLGGISSLAYSQEELEEDGDVFELSPFVVTGEDDVGYRATSTLAGTRIRTNLGDVGSAISVMTEEFLDDLGAVDNEGSLSYLPSAEVGGPRGNFSGAAIGSSVNEMSTFVNPNLNTRIRGLASADNTRNYFRTDAPWDGYIVNRVDLARGPNSILFGLGSPAGVVNATLDGAVFEDEGKVELQFDKWGSIRSSVNLNKVILEDELALRIAVLNDDGKFQQDPAYEEDRRLYSAVSYKPKFLNSDRMSTYFSANVESGKVESNRPRFITPQDLFTQWFVPVSEGGAGYETVNFNSAETDPNSVADDLPPHVTFKPWAGRLGSDARGWFMYDHELGLMDVLNPYLKVKGALNPDGSVVEAYSGEQLMDADTFLPAISTYPDYARVTGLPFGDSGLFVQKHLMDPGVFNFYEHLLDGPNKQEHMDWTNYELSFSQTFFEGKVGYDASFFHQNFESGIDTVLGGGINLMVEMNETLHPEDSFSDNPNDPIGIVPDPAKLNPDLGRAYYKADDSGYSNVTSTDRKAYRFQAFAEYDFEKKSDGNFLNRLLGKHRITGALMYEDEYRDLRRFNSVGWDEESRERLTGNNILNYAANQMTFNYYVSDNLTGFPVSDISSLNLPNIKHRIYPSVSGPITVERFFPEWNPPPGVQPGDEFLNNHFRNLEDIAEGGQGRFSYQSMNAANYVGRQDDTLNLLVASYDQASRDALTYDAQLSLSETDSQVFVYQANLWNNSTILTYGYREDQASGGVHAPNIDEPGELFGDQSVNLSPDIYNFGKVPITDLDTESTNWSVVMHLNKLVPDKSLLPLDVSVFYYNGENYQPAAERVDAFGAPLAPPQGLTEEYGFMLGTKDGKYSLRVTQYETKINNSTSTFPDLDSNMFWLNHTIAAGSEGYYNFVVSEDWKIENYENADLFGDDDAAAQEYLRNEVIPAWAQFEDDLEETYPEFIEKWVRGPWNPASTGLSMIAPPDGHAYTEDSISEGYELEFTANPFENLRLYISWSETEAIRDNVPGNVSEIFNFVRDYITTTPAGHMPAWWETSPGVVVNIWPNISGFLAKVNALNGQTQPEIRKHRFNAVANYSFSEGALKGVGVGSGLRYASSSVIGYEPQGYDDTGSLIIDVDKNFDDGSRTNVDFWISYGLPLGDKLDMDIQLNLYNAFGENELVPINVQPDGDYGAFRIQEGRSWQLRTTFRF